MTKIPGFGFVQFGGGGKEVNDQKKGDRLGRK